MQGSEVVRGAALAGALVCVLAMTGCSGEEPENGPPQSTTTPTTSAAWENGLSDEQVDIAYEGVDWLNAYDSEADAIYAEGKATPEAKEFFQSHLTNWAVAWDGLQHREASGLTTKKQSGWNAETTPSSVVIAADGAADVTVTRCVDATKIEHFVQDELQPKPEVNSYTQTAELVRYPDGRWLLNVINTDTEAACVTS